MGIPRRYPLGSATIIFNNIDWYGDGRYLDLKPIPNRLISYKSLNNRLPIAGISHACPWTPQSFLSSNIIFQSDWWMPKRLKSLWALVELEYPSNYAQTIKDVSSEVKLKLSNLGKIKNEIYIVAPLQEEMTIINQRNIQVQEKLQDVNNIMQNFVNNNKLPYERDYLPEIFTSNLGISIKCSLQKYFKPRGFKYCANEYSHGLSVITKITDYNSQIKLIFDSGSFGGHLGCTLVYSGHVWSFSFELIICKGNNVKTCHYINQNELDRIVENVGLVVDYLEETVVRDIKEICGTVPLWYKY